MFQRDPICDDLIDGGCAYPSAERWPIGVTIMCSIGEASGGPCYGIGEDGGQRGICRTVITV